MPKIAQIVAHINTNSKNKTKIILVGVFNNSDAIHEKSKIALEQYKRGNLKQMYNELYPDSPEDFELFLVYNCEFSLCVLDWDGTIN